MPTPVTLTRNAAVPTDTPVETGIAADPLVVSMAAGTASIGTVSINQTTPGTTNGVVVNAGGSIGEIQASPTANTVLDRLKALLTGIVLAAGSAIIGKVGIDQTTPGTTNGVYLTGQTSVGATTIATWTPAAAAYSANDVMSTAQTFALAGPSAGNIRILSSELLISETALQASEAAYRLHLYSVTPPSALADNAAWDIPSGDRASYLGFIELGTPVDLGSSLYVQASQNKDVLLAGTSLFGYLVTIAGFTATATARKVTLHTMPI